MRITVMGCVGRETFDEAASSKLRTKRQEGATGLIGAMDLRTMGKTHSRNESSALIETTFRVLLEDQ